MSRGILAACTCMLVLSAPVPPVSLAQEIWPPGCPLSLHDEATDMWRVGNSVAYFALTEVVATSPGLKYCEEKGVLADWLLQALTRAQWAHRGPRWAGLTEVLATAHVEGFPFADGAARAFYLRGKARIGFAEWVPLMDFVRSLLRSRTPKEAKYPSTGIAFILKRYLCPPAGLPGWLWRLWYDALCSGDFRLPDIVDPSTQ